MNELPPFEALFRSDITARDAFRSRLFGPFSEDVVRYWCASEHAPYRDLGRPSAWPGADLRNARLHPRGTRRWPACVGELKNEMAFATYQYLRLTDPAQLTHHGAKRPFTRLLTRGLTVSGAHPPPEKGCHVYDLGHR